MLATAWSAEQLAAAGKSAAAASSTVSDAQRSRAPAFDARPTGTALPSQSTQQVNVYGAPAQTILAGAGQIGAVPESRSSLAVETSVSLRAATASAARGMDQLAVASGARPAENAGGWTALELIVMSLALALAALFALRAWLQRAAHRSFGA
jgi:hypothetical protein